MNRNERANRAVARREALRTAARWTGLAVLGGWLAGVTLRRGRGDSARRAGLCARCPSLPSCSLSEGKRARDAMGVARTGPAGQSDLPRLCVPAGDTFEVEG